MSWRVAFNVNIFHNKFTEKIITQEFDSSKLKFILHFLRDQKRGLFDFFRGRGIGAGVGAKSFGYPLNSAKVSSRTKYYTFLSIPLMSFPFIQLPPPKHVIYNLVIFKTNLHQMNISFDNFKLKIAQKLFFNYCHFKCTPDC